jgi:signal transduction histidine kinase
MERKFVRWIYVLLAVATLAMAAWQYAAHQQARLALREDLLDRAEDISRAIAVVIRAESRFDGVPQQRVEAILEELTASTDLLSVSVRGASGDVTAQAGPALPFALEEVSRQQAYWLSDSAVFVNLVALGAGAGKSTRREWRGGGDRDSRFKNGGPGRGGAPDKDSGHSALDRLIRHDVRRLLPPEIHDQIRAHMNGEPLTDTDVGDIISQFPPHVMSDAVATTVSDALVGKVLTEALLSDLQLVLRHNKSDGPRRGRRGPRWMDGDHARLLGMRGVHTFVLEVPALETYAAVRNDLRMRLLIVSMALAVSLVLVYLLWTLKRSANLHVRLAQSEALTSHLAELNTAAAGLVHETKNPLNLIRGQAQMLDRESVLGAGERETARRIIEEADRVAGRLNQFLDYSKPLAPELGRVDFEGLVKDVFALLECDREEKQISFDFSTDGVDAIRADGALLRQVIFNLLINAVEAVGSQGRVEVILTRDGGDTARIDVRDNGHGVDESLRETLFQPYVTGTERGTGLGLTIVRQIALAHGWSVTCRNNKNGGATFQISQLEVAN